LAKATIRPEDARNPVRPLGSERGFPPSVAVHIAASEFANSVRNGRISCLLGNTHKMCYTHVIAS
jgi:hypothetical protein